MAAWVLTASILCSAVSQGSDKDGKSVAPVDGQGVAFAGYASVAKDYLFVLYDTEAKQCSLWIRIGQAWRGYTLMSFDPKTETLTIRKEKADYALSLRSSKIGAAVSLPGLVNGTYTLVDGTVVYSPDAQLKLGSGWLISSPTGVMVSDKEQKIIAGDLTLQNAKRTMQATDAVLDVSTGRVMAKGLVMRVKESNQPPPTPAAGTPPVAKDLPKP